jgi:hypothetical protein
MRIRATGFTGWGRPRIFRANSVALCCSFDLPMALAMSRIARLAALPSVDLTGLRIANPSINKRGPNVRLRPEADIAGRSLEIGLGHYWKSASFRKG